MDAMDNGLFAFRKYGYFVVDLFNRHRTHAGLEGRLPNPGDDGCASISLDSYRWQKHCHGLYELRRLPRDFRNSPWTGARCQPSLGRRYHLHPDSIQLRLSGGDSGSVFASDRWLGHLHTHRHATLRRRIAQSFRNPPGPRLHSSLRPWRSTCFRSLCDPAPPTRAPEEVHLWNYETYDYVIERLPFFLEEVYNRKRLHSSIGYVPPTEFEAAISNMKPADRPVLNL